MAPILCRTSFPVFSVFYEKQITDGKALTAVLVEKKFLSLRFLIFLACVIQLPRHATRYIFKDFFNHSLNNTELMNFEVLVFFITPKSFKFFLYISSFFNSSAQRLSTYAQL